MINQRSQGECAFGKRSLEESPASLAVAQGGEFSG